MTASVSRRRFLVRCGALGAVAFAAQLPGAGLARAVIQPVARDASEALRLLAVDTMAGLVAFAVPGPDRYSQVQGVTSATPGGVAALAPDGMIETFDRFLPLPDTVLQATATSLGAAMSDVPVPELDAALAGVETHAATVDEALLALTANDQVVPLSLVVALMLNFVATSVDPASIGGPFPGSPFANLKFADKAEVFRRLEDDNAELVALLDGGGAEPMRGTFSGAVALLGGVLLAFAVVLSYCEWGVLDRERGVATRRPIGWDISRYALGRTTPADGWNDLRGYYRGRRRAD